MPSDEFTVYETSESVNESSIELGRAAPDHLSDAANTSDSSDGMEHIPTPTQRRHQFPNFFPLLTFCRYITVVYAADFVTTEFASPSIRHACVRINKLQKLILCKINNYFSWYILQCSSFQTTYLKKLWPGLVSIRGFQIPPQKNYYIGYCFWRPMHSI